MKKTLASLLLVASLELSNQAYGSISMDEAAEIEKKLISLCQTQITSLRGQCEADFQQIFKNTLSCIGDADFQYFKEHEALLTDTTKVNIEWIQSVIGDSSLKHSDTDLVSEFERILNVQREKNLTEAKNFFYDHLPNSLQTDFSVYRRNFNFTFGEIADHLIFKLQTVHITSYDGMFPANSIIASFIGKSKRKKVIHIAKAAKAEGRESQRFAIKTHAIINPIQTNRNLNGVSVRLSSTTNSSLALVNNDGNVHTHPVGAGIALSPDNMHIEGIPTGTCILSEPDQIYSFVSHVDYDPENVHVDTFHLLLPLLKDAESGIMKIYEIVRKAYFEKEVSFTRNEITGIVERQECNEPLTFRRFMEKVEETTYYKNNSFLMLCWDAMKQFIAEDA